MNKKTNNNASVYAKTGWKWQSEKNKAKNPPTKIVLIVEYVPSIKALLPIFLVGHTNAVIPIEISKYKK